MTSAEGGGEREGERGGRSGGRGRAEGRAHPGPLQCLPCSAAPDPPREPRMREPWQLSAVRLPPQGRRLIPLPPRRSFRPSGRSCGAAQSSAPLMPWTSSFLLPRFLIPASLPVRFLTCRSRLHPGLQPPSSVAFRRASSRRCSAPPGASSPPKPPGPLGRLQPGSGRGSVTAL